MAQTFFEDLETAMYPSARILPEVGFNSPAAIMPRVDFPLPLSPNNPTVSPGFTEISAF